MPLSVKPLSDKPCASHSTPCRSILLLTGLLLSLGSGVLTAQQSELAGEKVVHLLDEPRHRTVRAEGGLFLLDVQINPGDISFSHVHDQAILLTYISAGSGPRGGEVSSIPEYASEPYTHKVGNDGPGLLRIIALVNDTEGKLSVNADAPSGIEQDADILNPWFRSWHISLPAGAATELQTHYNPTVIVQGSEGRLHVSREDGLTRELAAPGEWAWRDAGSAFRIHNVGDSEVSLAINEGRQPDG